MHPDLESTLGVPEVPHCSKKTSSTGGRGHNRQYGNAKQQKPPPSGGDGGGNSGRVLIRGPGGANRRQKFRKSERLPDQSFWKTAGGYEHSGWSAENPRVGGGKVPA